MEKIRKLEDKIELWLRPLPHLPADWQKWLAESSWWLILAVVILSVLSIFQILATLAVTMSWTGVVPGMYSYLPLRVYSSWWLVSIIISLIVVVVSLILEIMAIQPLKAMKRRGWDLLFIAYLVGVTGSIAGSVVVFDFTSLIPNLVGTAISATIGAYILFEIRSHFRIISLTNQNKHATT